MPHNAAKYITYWTKGHYRIVYVGHSMVVKFPNPFRWRHFLKGWLRNLQEKQFANTKEPLYQKYLCPVVWTGFMGMVLVARRAEPINEQEYQHLHIELPKEELYYLPIQDRLETWGKLKCDDGNERFVAIEYGD